MWRDFLSPDYYSVAISVNWGRVFTRATLPALLSRNIVFLFLKPRKKKGGGGGGENKKLETLVRRGTTVASQAGETTSAPASAACGPGWGRQQGQAARAGSPGVPAAEACGDALTGAGVCLSTASPSRGGSHPASQHPQSRAGRTQGGAGRGASSPPWGCPRGCLREMGLS